MGKPDFSANYIDESSSVIFIARVSRLIAISAAAIEAMFGVSVTNKVYTAFLNKRNIY